MVWSIKKYDSECQLMDLGRVLFSPYFCEWPQKLWWCACFQDLSGVAGCHSVLPPLIVVPFSKESCKKLPSKVDFLLSIMAFIHITDRFCFLKAFLLLISCFGFSTNSDALFSSVSEILNILCLEITLLWLSSNFQPVLSCHKLDSHHNDFIVLPT